MLSVQSVCYSNVCNLVKPTGPLICPLFQSIRPLRSGPVEEMSSLGETQRFRPVYHVSTTGKFPNIHCSSYAAWKCH